MLTGAAKLKRCSTRHLSEVRAIARESEFVMDGYFPCSLMNTNQLPLLLLVTPLAFGQSTITAPQGSTINNATATVFQPRFLSGTWNFVNGEGNVSEVITFSNQDLCPNCKWDSQHAAAFSGIFSGHPISGTYTWETVPSPPSVYKLAPTSSLSLMYQYHH